MTPKKEPFSEPLPSTPTSSEFPPLFENMVAFTSSPVLEFEAFSAAKTETAPVGGDLYEQNAEFGVFSAGNTETASENAVFGVFSAGSSESALVEATPYRKDAEVDVAVAVPELPRPLECLQGNPIPPFLSKTYDLVDDDSLDPIISWGRSGESFVVWDPLEFARIVLPRNFKHNNFSSFVRQLNTYGFRKIDTDKWEFANEAFRRGQKHLLKTIQRRRATQSQQVGRYVGALTEAGTSGMESELEKLREEKNLLMQEVVELQEEQRGTVHHMEAVNERLQGAEKRQKQMVSFLAKLLHNPEFVARLQQKRDQREIESSRPKRKFIKQHPHGIGKSESPVGEQIVKYESDWRNLAVSCGNPVSNPVLLGSSPDYLLEGMIGAEFTKEDSTFQTENVTSGELALSADFPVTRGFFEQVGEGPSVPRTEGPLFKGKNVVGPQPEVSEEYCTASLCEEFAKERNFPEFSPSSTEVVCKQEDMWNMSFDVTSSMPSSSSQLWGDIPCYDMPDLGATVGMSDVWDFSSLQVSDVLGTDQWPAEASDYDQHEIQAGQSRDDKSKDTSP